MKHCVCILETCPSANTVSGIFSFTGKDTSFLLRLPRTPKALTCIKNAHFLDSCGITLSAAIELPWGRGGMVLPRVKQSAKNASARRGVL